MPKSVNFKAHNNFEAASYINKAYFTYILQTMMSFIQINLPEKKKKMIRDLMNQCIILKLSHNKFKTKR